MAHHTDARSAMTWEHRDSIAALAIAVAATASAAFIWGRV